MYLLCTSLDLAGPRWARRTKTGIAQLANCDCIANEQVDRPDLTPPIISTVVLKHQRVCHVPTTMLPKSIALIEDDESRSEVLSRYVGEHGIRVDTFSDSNDLLTHPQPFGYDFYVVDLMLPGIDRADLIKVLRHRSEAGILVISARGAADAFEHVLQSGEDMFLTKPWASGRR